MEGGPRSLFSTGRYLLFLLGCILLLSIPVRMGFVQDSMQAPQEGRDTFQSTCAKCHDEDAQGDGPMHTSFIPPPANLTLVRNTRPMMVSIIRNGVPGTPMPDFDLPDQRIASVMQYIEAQPRSTEREWGFPWRAGEENASAALGSALYQTACFGCHGETGKGDGYWADEEKVWPKPTNFTARSSETGRLFYITKHGRPGTFMPAQQDKFPDFAIQALAEYVHAFYDPKSSDTIPVPDGQIVRLSNPFARDDQDAISRGESTYNLFCVACHGADAIGSFLAPRLVDREWRYGGGSDTAVFTIIEKGVPGKLMPGHEQLSEDRRWAVITWLRHRGGQPDPLLHHEDEENGEEGHR